ncbi:hypothetical protein CDL12_26371 [Handroanthus impetiginosus]|uniref:[Myosin heavy-chain] kinase n=1 Tax=Handroanthus impetiginosus TaxID=429701 RepID=A0A2G9G737_9LAMI|nr:hypothetical protein CDL12_26371 [Handroanthus impetiginosus]
MQVRYSSDGGIYVTASKDTGWGKFPMLQFNSWCLRSGRSYSANLKKDDRYILSSGKDSIINLWEVGIGRLLKQYLRATHTEIQCQVMC